jgi:16S rRNA (adenine1518-N6/adenine1519-N6)-dimethyltransferase
MEPLEAQTRALLRRFNLQAKKSLGQHFLIDGEVFKIITSAAELVSSDVIMEIGSGLGILTSELARQVGWVIAIEIDSKLAAVLERTLVSFRNVTVLNEDILTINPEALIHAQCARLPVVINSPYTYKVVANLPYYITSAVLRHFMEASVKPQIMVVMVQREVAEAIVAKHGRMSLLSISVQFYGKPTIISQVPAQCFHPTPEVDSAILRIDLYPKPPVAVTNEKSFFNLVRAGFSASRKQIVNSLANGLEMSKVEVLTMLEKASIIPQRRAETLSLDEWAQLWRVICAGE